MLTETQMTPAAMLGDHILGRRVMSLEAIKAGGSPAKIGLIAACIHRGYDTAQEIKWLSVGLIDEWEVEWTLKRGTGLTRKRRIWDSLPSGRYVLRDKINI